MVRIRPGSVLDYLYPLSKHAPDRCCLCGSTFEGHLNRWWVRRGKAGSPYDRMLDEISRDGIRGAYLGDGGGGKERAVKPHDPLGCPTRLSRFCHSIGNMWRNPPTKMPGGEALH